LLEPYVLTPRRDWDHS
jgi:hypothetical protein